MRDSPPTIILIGGPNGAGKSTVAPALLSDYLGIDSFVNADTIARGLSGFDPERVTFEAGRTMLKELRRRASSRESFAFESTLASRSFAPWIRGLIDNAGYEFILTYIWVASPDLAVQRVAHRVRSGGHQVPEEDIRRRWHRSIQNLFNLYIPLAHRWYVYDNSAGENPMRIAQGGLNQTDRILQPARWELLRMAYDDPTKG